MSNREPIVLCWSGGKDSSLAWHALRDHPAYEVVSLLTTFTEGYGRVSMHGVRYDLLMAQAERLELPVEEVWIPPRADNAIYETRMAASLRKLRETFGIGTVAFGDLFLEDLKQYREHQLADCGMRAIFPLWKRDTQELAAEFVSLGFHGVTVCIDPSRLDAAFIGRELDAAFFADLPEDCDACGENGEYHSFVYAAPGWSAEIPFKRGEIVSRDSFLFCDLLPQLMTQHSTID